MTKKAKIDEQITQMMLGGYVISYDKPCFVLMGLSGNCLSV